MTLGSEKGENWGPRLLDLSGEGAAPRLLGLREAGAGVWTLWSEGGEGWAWTPASERVEDKGSRSRNPDSSGYLCFNSQI